MAADIRIALLAWLHKADPEQRNDFVHHAVERLAQSIIKVEAKQKIGAGRYERAETRTNSRNGGGGRACRCCWSPGVGPIEPWPTW